MFISCLLVWCYINPPNCKSFHSFTVLITQWLLKWRLSWSLKKKSHSRAFLIHRQSIFSQCREASCIFALMQRLRKIRGFLKNDCKTFDPQVTSLNWFLTVVKAWTAPYVSGLPADKQACVCQLLIGARCVALVRICLPVSMLISILVRVIKMWIEC